MERSPFPINIFFRTIIAKTITLITNKITVFLLLVQASDSHQIMRYECINMCSDSTCIFLLK